MQTTKSRFAALLCFASLLVSGVAWAQDQPAEAAPAEPQAEAEAAVAEGDNTEAAAEDTAVAEDDSEAMAEDEDASEDQVNGAGDGKMRFVLIPAEEPKEKAKWSYGGEEWTLLNYRLTRDTLELQMFAGLSIARQEVPVHAEDTGGSPFGFSGALSVIWRLDWVFSLFFETGYTMMGASETRAEIDDGVFVDTDSSLAAFGNHFGILLDVWYLRARLGFGSTLMLNSVSVEGDEASSSNLDFTYVIGLGGSFYRDNKMNIGAEARVFLNPALETGYLGFGVTFAYDVLAL